MAVMVMIGGWGHLPTLAHARIPKRGTPIRVPRITFWRRRDGTTSERPRSCTLGLGAEIENFESEIALSRVFQNSERLGLGAAREDRSFGVRAFAPTVKEE